MVAMGCFRTPSFLATSRAAARALLTSLSKKLLAPSRAWVSDRCLEAGGAAGVPAAVFAGLCACLASSESK